MSRVERKDLTPTQLRSLLSWLDQGVASGGQRYLEIRRRIVIYFEQKRCDSADDLADETLNRVARRLADEGTIDTSTPLHFCYITARFVFLEHWRSTNRKTARLTQAKEQRRISAADDPADDRQERLHACLERCLDALSRTDRDLILDYYRGGPGAQIAGRRQLAARLSLSANALAIRASRVRHRLEACVTGCANGDDRFGQELPH